jgi:2-dehydro-3-deoxygalactonokinase
MTPAPRLIGLDWGTTRLRAFLLGADGTVLDARAQPWGVRQLPEGGFAAALAAVADGWPRCPVLASGMVGSRSGWREAPYVDLPADVHAVAAALTRVRDAEGRDLAIVPGLRHAAAPDMLRGEETQVIGTLALRPELAAQATLLLPGTHSKWVTVRDGTVVDFATCMTGELYALLSRHSILAGAGTAVAGSSPPDRDNAFVRGVQAARDSGAAGALSRLFSVRALMLDNRLDASAVPDYLSGLLIGEELRGALAAGRADRATPLHMVGDAGLCARYRTAAACFSLQASAAVEGAAAQGLWRIALAAGLVDESAVMPSGEVLP